MTLAQVMALADHHRVATGADRDQPGRPYAAAVPAAPATQGTAADLLALARMPRL